MNKFDIIIPSWNQSEYVVNCLKSIRQYSNDYQVIFVDNGSNQTELDIIFPILETIPHRYIKLEENKGFIKATNIGIVHSNAPYIVLMNNDTEAVPNWLEKLVQPLEENHKVGLSGPLTTTPNSWQGKYDKDKTGYVIRKSGMLAFFCTMFKRQVFESVGFLDETFGVGFGDDDDYCKRCLDKGWDMALVQDLIIPHHHRTTFKTIYGEENIKVMQDEALKHYYEKHNINVRN